MATNRVQLNLPQTAQMLGCGISTVKKLTALGSLTDTSPLPREGAVKRFSTYDLNQVQALARTGWRHLTRPARTDVRATAVATLTTPVWAQRLEQKVDDLSAFIRGERR